MQKSGNSIIITDDEGNPMDFTYTVGKNNLALSQVYSEQGGDPDVNGYAYDYVQTLTMNFNR